MYKKLGGMENYSMIQKLKQLYNLVYIKENYSIIKCYTKILRQIENENLRYLKLINQVKLKRIIYCIDDILKYNKDNRCINIHSLYSNITKSLLEDLTALYNYQYLLSSVKQQKTAIKMENLMLNTLGTNTLKNESCKAIERYLVCLLQLLGYKNTLSMGDVFDMYVELEDIELDYNHLAEYEYKVLCLVIKLPLLDYKFKQNIYHSDFIDNLKQRCGSILGYDERRNDLTYSGLSLNGELILLFEELDTIKINIIEDIVNIFRYCENENHKMALS